MAFFDQVGQKLTKTSQEAVQKTKDMAEIVRLNNGISEQQKKIDSACLEIGKLYYANYADRGDEIFQPCVEQIRQAEAAAAGMKEAVRRLKGLSVCPACGNEQQSGAVFCNSCGAQMPQVQEEDSELEEKGMKCKACGAAMPEGTVFCMNCGARLEEEEEQL